MTAAARDTDTLLVSRTWQPDEVDLFMYSAVTWLTHRIHFDQAYARTEGYPNVLVHGPFQGSYLAQLLFEYAQPHGGTLAGMAFRHHKPVYCGESMTCLVRAASVDPGPDRCVVQVELRIQDGEGTAATTGSATLELPADWRPEPAPEAA